MDKIKKILEFAMRMEKDAQNFYEYYSDKASSDASKKLFNELSAIEEKHYNVLKSKYDQLGFEKTPLEISWVVDNSFEERNPSILAMGSELNYNDESASDLTIMRMAFLIENDFAEFYKNASGQVDDLEIKGFLNTLAKWEEAHRKMFYDRYQALLKANWSELTSIIFN